MAALDGCTVDKSVINIFCCTKHMALDILKSERNIMIQEIRKADKINVNHGIL